MLAFSTPSVHLDVNSQYTSRARSRDTCHAIQPATLATFQSSVHLPRLRIRMETNSWSLHRAGNYSFTMYSYYVVKYWLFLHTLTTKCTLAKKISYMHLVASIHYIHLRFVASRLFYFLLLDRNSMYIIILNLLYTHSNRRVVA